MPTLEFKFRVGGTLTNATSVVLADSTGTYGVKRLDTDATVVAVNTAMTNYATGVYRYSLTAPAAGLTYSWVAKVVYGGVTYYFEHEFTDVSTVADGTYCDQSDIEDVFGESNVQKWSQLDNTVATTDGTRVQTACDWADAEINNYFRDSVYAVPLTLSSGTQTLTDWAAKLAGVWLYRNRGTQDDAPANQYDEMESRVRAEMARYKSGELRLDATRALSQMPTHPIVIG